MQQLASYASAIHQHSSPVRIVQQTSEHERWIDQGFEVSRERTVYVFDNGVVISREVEQDQFPSELACAECWISYCVLDDAGLPHIQPQQKSFANACRESFWLAYHTASGSTV